MKLEMNRYLMEAKRVKLEMLKIVYLHNVDQQNKIILFQSKLNCTSERLGEEVVVMTTDSSNTSGTIHIIP